MHNQKNLILQMFNKSNLFKVYLNNHLKLILLLISESFDNCIFYSNPFPAIFFKNFF